MRKEAWTYSLTAAILGALGVLIRWLQCQQIFEPDTGLAVKDAFVSVLMVLTLAAFAWALWWLSGKMDLEYTAPEPEEALALPNRYVGWALTFGAVIAAGGALLQFFTADNMFFRAVALLGLLSAAVLGMLPSLPRWGNFGAALVLAPVLFFALWLVGYYKENSVNPVVWGYAMQILAMAACLLAVFRLCGYVYYRMKPRQTLFACGLGGTLGLTVLMDNAPGPARLLFAGWGIGLCVLCWILLDNLQLPGEKE